MNKLAERFLVLSRILTLAFPPTPAYALRGQEPVQTGLEEKLRKALRSPDDLVNAVSTALGLNPPAPAAGLPPAASAQGGLEEEVLKGHQGAVRYLGFTEEGRLLSADAKGVVVSWGAEAKKRKPVRQSRVMATLKGVLTQAATGPNRFVVSKALHLPSQRLFLLIGRADLAEDDQKLSYSAVLEIRDLKSAQRAASLEFEEFEMSQPPNDVKIIVSPDGQSLGIVDSGLDKTVTVYHLRGGGMLKGSSP